MHASWNDAHEWMESRRPVEIAQRMRDRPCYAVQTHNDCEMTMDANTQEVLNQYIARAAEEARLWETLPGREIWDRRDEFLLQIGEETGELLSLLIVAARPRVILEIGTSYGYSTLYMAEAARRVGAKVITIELSADKSQYAQEAMLRAGLQHLIEFRVGDACNVLQELTGPFDFVLLDLWKPLYVRCLELVLPKLSSQSILVADNMIYPTETKSESDAYRAAVRKHGLDSVLLRVGSGIEISTPCKDP
jgi:predicted O-methyltransferase YrrM